MLPRVLLVSGRSDIQDALLGDPEAERYTVERRPPNMVGVADCARDFSMAIVDVGTTPDGVNLGRALRAANRAMEFIPVVTPDTERVGVEALKFGAFDYLVWPPAKASELWTLVARCLEKVAPPEPKTFPRKFGKYRLLGKLGEGGMAEIFLAQQPSALSGSAREVVVKRLHDSLSSGDEFVKMFADEARISSMLNHPNVVRVHDFGKIEDGLFIEMEYIPGRNLEELRRMVGGPLPPALACYIVAEICAGLGYAHGKLDDKGVPLGIVHRDVNPPNVLIADDGRVMLTDFGIAKAAHRYSETSGGVLKGKFEFMSPEQANGEAVDRRTDIFCVGLILYELLAGRRPFQAATPIETLVRIQQCKIEPPSSINHRLPEVLDKITMMALEKNRDARYQEASELERHLRAFARRATNPGPRDLALFAKSASGQAVLAVRETTGAHTAPGVPAPLGSPPEVDVSENRATIRETTARSSVPTTTGPRPDPEPEITRPGRDESVNATKILGESRDATIIRQGEPQPRARSLDPSAVSTVEGRKPTPEFSSEGLFPAGAKEATLKARQLKMGGGILVALALVTAGGLLGESILREGSPPPRLVERVIPPMPTRASAYPRVPQSSLTPSLVAATPRPAAAASTVAPAPRPGRLSVWVDGWATVYVDGVKQSQPAPFADAPIPAGKHRVTLENGAHERRNFDVTVAPGKTAVVNGGLPVVTD